MKNNETRQFVPLSGYLRLTKAQLRKKLREEDHTYISYSGHDKGFYFN